MKRRKNYWQLLWVIIKTDFKLRYYGSVLGYFWSLFKPLLMFFVLYVVFSVLIRWDIENYQLFLLLGIILWNFFSEATINGLHAFYSKAGIIKKIYFPRIFVVLSPVIIAFITLLLNMAVFFVVYLFVGGGWSFWMLLFPLFLVLFCLLALACALFLSILYVFFKDISQIWDIILQIGFYLSPIIYPLALVPEKYRVYLYVNPMTGLIQYSRDILIGHSAPEFLGVIYIGVFILLFLFCAYFFFRKMSLYVIEKI